MTERFPIFLG